MSKLWSCEFKLAECRNPFGCHCREIVALHHQVKTLERLRRKIKEIHDITQDTWIDAEEGDMS